MIQRIVTELKAFYNTEIAQLRTALLAYLAANKLKVITISTIAVIVASGNTLRVVGLIVSLGLKVVGKFV